MCQFSLAYSGDALSLLRRAKQEIERTGGTLVGSDAEGEFQAKTPIGSIRGTYHVDGQQITLAILKKPLLLSCTRIQKELAAVMT